MDQTAQEDNRFNYIYIHRDTSRRNIFENPQDYEVFLEYLKSYLTKPPSTEQSKKTFTVRGRIFKGLPRQTQNFFNKVELLAYNLEPKHLDLLLKENELGYSEKLMRSISTRYAKYFNKKYHKSGVFFEKQYKAIKIDDNLSLLKITNIIHNKQSHTYSSYLEYFGKRKTSWVKSDIIRSLIKTYSQEVNSKKQYWHEWRIPEILVATVIFFVFTIYSLNNIHASSQKNQISLTPPTPESSQVLSESVNNTIEPNPTPETPIIQEPTPTETTAPEVSEIEDIDNQSPKPTNNISSGEASSKFIVVTITDESPSVNIRQEPTIYSEKIGTAKEGDIFEYLPVNPYWYQIKLNNGLTGYIAIKYTKIIEKNNNL